MAEDNPSNRQYFKLNENYKKSINFEHVTHEWMNKMKSDNDLKVLVVENCRDIQAASKLLFAMSKYFFQNLFVVVLNFTERFVSPTTYEVNRLAMLFEDRPMIIQLSFLPNGVNSIFVKDQNGIGFNNMSAEQVFGDNKKLKRMLEIHGKMPDNDVLKTELSLIPQVTPESEGMATSMLCLRVMNLFVGGCNRIVPWLTRNPRLLHAMRLEELLAFNDYPFNHMAAVDLAWAFKRYDLVEMMVARDSPFPKDFNIYLMLPNMNVGFKKVLDQRGELHRHISKKNHAGAAKVLEEIRQTRKIRRIFNEAGDSAMATLLKNFDVEMYKLLMNKKLKFCFKYHELVMDLPPSTRETIANENFAYFTPYEAGPGDHPMMAKCMIANGHIRKDYYFGCIRAFLMQLEKIPETTQILRFAQKFKDMRLVFDFKNGDIGHMDPRHEGSPTSCASFNASGLVYISALNMDYSVCGIICHALASLVLLAVYRDVKRPYPNDDHVRKYAFHDAIAECRLNHKNRVSDVVHDFYRVIETYGDDDKMGSQLLLSVPHILAGHTEAELRETKIKFSKIFNYYRKYVVRDIELARRSRAFRKV